MANVIATSGRAVEAAGDVDVLLLDKTGTITLGNRQAIEFPARHIHSVFLSQVLLLLPDDAGRLAERAAESVTYLFDVREQAVSQWVYDHGRMAGKTTDTLPAAKGLYLPLRTSRGIVGVLGVHPADPQRLVDPEQLHLLEAFANQIALAIE